MIQLLLLAGWALSGVALAGLLTPEPGHRFAWAALAVVLGPLWAAVANELRTSQRPGTAHELTFRTREASATRISVPLEPRLV